MSRKAHSRCPNCKKVRKIWMRANEWCRCRVASMNIRGLGKVCWICRIRAIQPDWRPGMPVPKIPDANKFISISSDEFKVYSVMES